MDVSVVVPAYRATGFITRAIDSALSQTGVQLEVIVVDDACPDRTGDFVREHYAGSEGVRVLGLATNGGPAVARNRGFEEAAGDWIAVLDADDAYEQGRLEHLIRQAETLEADIIADNVRVYYPATQTRSEPRLQSISRPEPIDVYKFVEGARPGRADMDLGLLKPIFRRDWMRAASLQYPRGVRHGEDFELYFRALMEGARFYIVPEAGYLWTSRQSGMSQTVTDYPSQVAQARRLQGDATARSTSKRAREI